MYFYQDFPNRNNVERHIFVVNDDGSYTTFAVDIISSVQQQYLAWVAEGNEPEPWNPAEATATEE